MKTLKRVHLALCKPAIAGCAAFTEKEVEGV
jgi:hypothetical protein